MEPLNRIIAGLILVSTIAWGQAYPVRATDEEKCKIEAAAAQADFIAKNGEVAVDEDNPEYRWRKAYWEKLRQYLPLLEERWNADMATLERERVKKIVEKYSDLKERDDRLFGYLKKALRHDEIYEYARKSEVVDIGEMKGRRVVAVGSRYLRQATDDGKPQTKHQLHLTYYLDLFDDSNLPENERFRPPMSANAYFDTDDLVHFASTGMLPKLDLKKLEEGMLGEPPRKQGRLEDYIAEWLAKRKLYCPNHMGVALKSEKIRDGWGVKGVPARERGSPRRQHDESGDDRRAI